jgi:hypothetical protein
VSVTASACCVLYTTSLSKIETSSRRITGNKLQGRTVGASNCSLQDFFAYWEEILLVVKWLIMLVIGLPQLVAELDGVRGRDVE